MTEIYGRKLLDNLRPGTPAHLYLPGPHRGVWNLGRFATCCATLVALAYMLRWLIIWWQVTILTLPGLRLLGLTLRGLTLRGLESA